MVSYLASEEWPMKSLFISRECKQGQNKAYQTPISQWGEHKLARFFHKQKYAEIIDDATWGLPSRMLNANL